MQNWQKAKAPRNMLNRSSAMVLAASLALAGCGEGGSDDSSTGDSTNTYSGVVEAPSGTTLAQSGAPGLWKSIGNLLIPTTVAGVSGLEAKAGVTVTLVELDDTGKELKTVETVTTDSAGKFTLETDLSPSTNYVFRVESSNAQMRTPMTRTDVPINPGTEMIVQAMETAIENNGAKLSDWSPEEVTSLVDSIDYDASDCLDIGSCVTNIKTAHPTIDETTETLASNDGVSGPDGDFAVWALRFSHTRGFYEVGHYYDRYAFTFGDDQISGNSILENEAWWRAGTTEMELDPDTSGEALDPFGAVPGSEGRLAIGASGLDGFYSPDNKVIALGERWSDELEFNGTTYTEDTRGLFVGIEKASSAPTLSGEYHTIGLGTETGENAATSKDGYRIFRSTYGLYTFDSVSGSFSYSGETEEESELVLPGTGTGTSGSITEPTSDTNSGSGNLTVTSDGTLKLDGSVAGQVHPDGDFLLVGEYENNAEDPDWAEASLYLGVKAGTGMGDGDLSGTYNYLKLSGAAEAEDGGYTDNTDSEIGSVTFDGDGNITDITSTRYDSGTGIGEAPDHNDTNPDSSSSGTYSVDSNGKVTLLGGTHKGAVTPDKEILVLRGALDIAHQHSILIGFKQP